LTQNLPPALSHRFQPSSWNQFQTDRWQSKWSDADMELFGNPINTHVLATYVLIVLAKITLGKGQRKKLQLVAMFGHSRIAGL
jgi:hypothetical protein